MVWNSKPRLGTIVEDHGLNSRVLEVKKMGYSIPKDEQDGSFTSDAVANLIRLVMVVEKGRIYREKVKKKKLRCKGYFSQVRHVLIIPNGENVQKCVSNLVLKFHDDPTVNDFEIALFPRQVWWYARKDRVFRGGEGKTKLKGKGGVGSIVKN
ncbi:hypothetical protein JHK82_022754 [Glycine max]|nr:hypothetical protein JHK82_022754 [Glycine max]